MYTLELSQQYIQLTLEILHYVQEGIVNIWLMLKLYLDSIEIAQRIHHIQGPFGGMTDNMVVVEFCAFSGPLVDETTDNMDNC